MSDIKCRKCGRKIHDGESAWASDWTVIDMAGTEAKFINEVRYSCDDCEPA